MRAVAQAAPPPLTTAAMYRLLGTELLPRLRFLLAAVEPADALGLPVLHILVRVARHSLSAATAVVDCPGLLDAVCRAFITAQDAPATATAVALRLLALLCAAGRGAAERATGSGRLTAAMRHAVSTSTAAGAQLCRAEAYATLTACLRSGVHVSVFEGMYPTLVGQLQGLGALLTAEATEPTLTAAGALLGVAGGGRKEGVGR